MDGTFGEDVLFIPENKYHTENNNRNLISFIYHQYILVCILMLMGMNS
jgi:hypothetical protein